MIRNYLKIAIRSMKKQWGYSLINLAGLAMSMACVILIMLWVQDELSYDRFHENRENLYIVGGTMFFGDNNQHWSYMPPALGPAMKTEYPEVVNTARMYPFNGLTMTVNNEVFSERTWAADAGLLEMFSFPLRLGEAKAALSDPRSIVITESVAERYFGDSNPLGQTIRVENQYDFQITGVMADIPQNSTLQFDILLPISFLAELNGPRSITIWDNYSFRTFVQLAEGSSPGLLNEKIKDRITRENDRKFCEPFLRRLTSLRLYWLGYGDGTIQEVRIFIMIAAFVLFIACVNFMNLTTARSGKRSREIGLRKVVGAGRKNLVGQFYGESLLLSLFAFIVSLIIVLLLLPTFSTLAGKQLRFNFIENPALIPVLIGIALLTGLAAGSYPALFMASFRPSSILKGSFKGGAKSAAFRKVLVVIQFALSISLMVGMNVVTRQLHYVQNRDLGFSRDQLVYVPLRPNFRDNWEPLKQAMLENPHILHASMTSYMPTNIRQNSIGWKWPGKDPEVDPLVTRLHTDFDVLNTFEMEMIQGSFFSKQRNYATTTAGKNIVINETFAELLGMDDPIGAEVSYWDNKLTVIGVVKDFHFTSLYNRIAPLAICYNPDRYHYLSIKITGDQIPNTMQQVERIYKQFSGGYPFEYHFLDEDYEGLYRSAQNIGSLIRSFTMLAIFISCLGLFGLAAFMAEQRTKEIGVRKVLGASVSSIIMLLSKDFIKWVLLANIIAWPLAYFFMRSWLQTFAYHIRLGFDSFILAAGMAVMIAVLTVSFQALRAAQANPGTALKYE